MSGLKSSKSILLLIVSIVITSSCQSLSIQSNEEDQTAESYQEECELIMTEWLNYLCSKECAGRYPGTEGSRNASDFIVSQLSSMGYKPSVQEFNVSDVTMRNILVAIPGLKDSSIVIGAHYDGQFPSNSSNHFPAANDNASGVVTLLRVAKDMSKKLVNCPYSICLCFWDGEENTLGNTFKGSGYYVSCSKELGKIKYYHNIDSVGHDHESSYRLFYYGEWVEKKAVPFVLDNCNLRFTEVTFRDKGVGSSDYVSFSKVGIPVINIVNDHSSGCNNLYHSVTDTPDAISITLLSTMANIVEIVMQI